MPPAMPTLGALAPALLLALFGFWCGTFRGAAAWPQAALGPAVLLLVALAGARSAVDPLGLGRAGRLLPWAAFAAALASWSASPVPRAGRVGLMLAPALLWAVPALARAWSTASRRDLGIAAWAASVAAVAGTALGQQVATSGHRAALPLGHHNLLAAFLVITLPVAALAWRRPGLSRVLAVAAVILGVAAVLASRSWLGLLALAAILLVASRRLPRLRRLVAGLALLALAALVPRAERMLAGADLSASGRWVYARAALEGLAARPAPGWGPGSTPWLLAEWLRPLPGVNPPGEVVGEAHSLPLQVAFELGLPGLALLIGVGGLFVLRRWRALESVQDPALSRAGLLGLGAGAIVALGGAHLSVPAIPVALMAAAAATLVGAAAAPRGAGWLGQAIVAGYVVSACIVLSGPVRAHAAYERGRAAPSRGAAVASLARAVALDPGFPLYRARAAWASEATAVERAAASRRAASEARGVAALWLRSGVDSFEAGEYEASRSAFEAAMALDPLSGVPPFLAFVASGGEDLDCAARALAAEPRLAAATFWRRVPAARERALARLATWPGLPPGYGAELARRLEPVPEPADDEVDLAVQMDVTPALAVSLHQFRRSPWVVDVARVRLERRTVRGLSGVASAVRVGTPKSAFPHDRCAPADA